MIKTINIHLMLAFALMTLGLQGCSDNYDAAVVPVKSNLMLKVDGHESAFSIDCGAEPNNDIRVSVESNTIWKIDIECEGGWCSSDKLTGRGDETFTLSILENINKERNAVVMVYIVDADGEKLSVAGQTTSIQMTLKQAVSDVRLAPSSFEPFKARGNERKRMEIDSNVPWTLDVSYEGENPTAFVSITPGDDRMVSLSDGKYSGDGNASFDMSVADNHTAAERRAYITLRSAVGTYSVEIIQNKSDITFDVSPSETQTVEAIGGTIEFGINSLSDWYIQSANDLSSWLTFSQSEGKASTDRVTTNATVAPNTTGYDRSAHIEFKATQEQYGKISIDIIQLAFDTSFTCSRSDDTGVIGEKGDNLLLELDSRFHWEASAPSWMSVNPRNGDASASISRISVGVNANRTSSNRTGTLTITPLPTEVAPGITINPSAIGIQPLYVSVTQFGGREAAISVPWLADDYTQTSATVEFNFFSPFYKIVEAGLEWGKENNPERTTTTVMLNDANEGTVSFSLTGLDSATKYVARGFVRDEDGNVKYGLWSFPFKTAGRYPGGDDNPTPSR